MARTLTIAAAAITLSLGLAGTSYAQQTGGAAGMQQGNGVAFQAGQLGRGYSSAQFAPGYAATGMTGGGMSYGQRAGIGGPGIPGAGVGGIGSQGMLAAPVPQYWLADASIFITSASKTASIMEGEQSLDVRAPHIIGSQAAYLVNTTSRALADLNALLQNARQTNPDAVPNIRNAMAELLAAQAQGHEVVMTASRGMLGPSYQVTVTSAKQHLRKAETMLAGIAKPYDADRFLKP